MPTTIVDINRLVSSGVSGIEVDETFTVRSIYMRIQPVSNNENLFQLASGIEVDFDTGILDLTGFTSPYAELTEIDTSIESGWYGLRISQSDGITADSIKWFENSGGFGDLKAYNMMLFQNEMSSVDFDWLDNNPDATALEIRQKFGLYIPVDNDPVMVGLVYKGEKLDNNIEGNGDYLFNIAQGDEDDIPRTFTKASGNPTINGSEIIFAAGEVQSVRDNSYWDYGVLYMVDCEVSNIAGTQGVILPYDGGSPEGAPYRQIAYSNGVYKYIYRPGYAGGNPVYIYTDINTSCTVIVNSIRKITLATINGAVWEVGQAEVITDSGGNFDTKNITDLEKLIVDAINADTTIGYLGLPAEREVGQLYTSPYDLLVNLPSIFVEIISMDINKIKKSGNGSIISQFEDHKVKVYLLSPFKKTSTTKTGISTMIVDCSNLLSGNKFGLSDIHGMMLNSCNEIVKANLEKNSQEFDMFYVWEMNFTLTYFRKVQQCV